jgi:hypothetical protein
MGWTDFQRFMNSCSGFTTPATHPSESEPNPAAHLHSDGLDGLPISWEAAWIDLGGEG